MDGKGHDSGSRAASYHGDGGGASSEFRGNWIRDERDARNYLSEIAYQAAGLIVVFGVVVWNLSPWILLLAVALVVMGAGPTTLRAHKLTDRTEHDSRASYALRVNHTRVKLVFSNEPFREALRVLGHRPQPFVAVKWFVFLGVFALFLAALVKTA